MTDQQMTIVEQNAFVLDAVLHDSNPVLAAAIRSASISDIPTWTVESVVFTKYTGEEYWEHVFDRLGKLICMPKDESSNFEINTTSPQYATICVAAGQSKERINITSAHFQSSHLKAIDTGMTICSLRNGQVLDVTLTLTFNTAREKNEKWSPSVATSTRSMPVISLDKTLLLEKNGHPTRLFRGLVSSCPTGVFSPDIEDFVDASKCIACRQCEQDYGLALNLKVTMDESIQRIHMETNGTMTAKSLLKSSLLTLADQTRHIFDL